MAFRNILGISDINFIYGGGSGNMPKVGTILQGWGCKVLYLYDTDQGGKDGKRSLTRKWLVEKADIQSISKKKDTRIEDLFIKDDFKKFVLKDESKDYTSSNSKYMSKAKKEKALLAKLFWSSSEKNEYKLSSETKTNFQKLFNILLKKFKSKPTK